MLGKLALRNVKRSMRDYGIYLLTVTISFSLIYAFNMVFFSKDIKNLNEVMGSLSIMIGFISVIVIAVIEWLVHYMNLFMLEKRSKELGTYMLLGISNKKISRMVLLENMIMGAVSFLGGLVAGTFLYQILTLIIMNVFQVKYRIKADISLPAILLTLFYILLIYAFSMLRMRKKLKRMKICDLIYADKQNETALIDRKKSHWILCIISFLLLASGCVAIYCIFHYTAYFSIVFLLLGFTLIIGGLYGFYIELAGLIMKVFLSKNERKFSKDNLFLFRNLSSKLKTMSLTLGTLAMLLTLTLTCIQSAALFNRYFQLSALNRCAFDAQVTSEDTEVFADAEEYFRKKRGIEARRQVPVYSCGQTMLYDNLEQSTYADSDYAISYSDYAALREMLGYKPVELKSGHYVIHAYPQIKKAADSKGDLSYAIKGMTLSLQAVYDEPLSQNGTIGVGCIIVFPDELAEKLELAYTALVLNTEKETTAADCQYLESLFENKNTQDGWYMSCDTKGSAVSYSRSSIITLGFGLYYAGLIFICTAAAILTVQQLSEASKYRFRYNILLKLGSTERKIGKLIFKQLLLYFGIPLLLPIPLSVFLSLCIREIMMDMIKPTTFWTSVSLGMGVFLLIYVLYFAAAYVGYRKSVLYS